MSLFGALSRGLASLTQRLQSNQVQDSDSGSDSDDDRLSVTSRSAQPGNGSEGVASENGTLSVPLPSDALETSALQFDHDTQGLLQCIEVMEQRAINKAIAQLEEDAENVLRGGPLGGLEKAIMRRENAFAAAERARWEMELEKLMRTIHEGLAETMAYPPSPQNIMDADEDAPLSEPTNPGYKPLLDIWDTIHALLDKKRKKRIVDRIHCIRGRMDRLAETLDAIEDDLDRDAVTVEAETREMRERHAERFTLVEGRNWPRPPPRGTGVGGCRLVDISNDEDGEQSGGPSQVAVNEPTSHASRSQSDTKE